MTYTWESSPRSAYNFDRLATMSYPARPEGGDPRTLTFHHGNDPAGVDNALGRVTMISEPGSPLVEHARYHYAGTGRRISVMRWNNVGNSVVDLGGTGYTGLDRHGRLADLHFKLAQDTVHRYQHTYDKAGNRITSRVTHAPTGDPPVAHDNDRSWLYAYDTLSRLVQAKSGQLDGQPGSFTIASAPFRTRTTWTLDTLGNWVDPYATSAGFAFQADTDGNGTFDQFDGIYHDVDHTNAVTAVDVNGTPQAFVNDLNGNLIFDGPYVYTYDAWNRLVTVHEAGTLDEGDFHGGRLFPDENNNPVHAPGPQVAAFTYGPLGRLIRADVRIVPAVGDPYTKTEHYYYDGVRRIQAVEARPDPTPDETRHEYVYAPDYVDEFVLESYRDSGGNQVPLYVLQDANFNVVALLDENGQVIEQYVWSPYGQLVLKDTMAAPAPENSVGHQGLFFYRFDAAGGDQATFTPAAQGLYYNRNRWYSPTLGRFTTKDPNETSLLLITVTAMNGDALGALVGSFDAQGHFGDGMNLYLFAASNPVTGSDSLGLYGGGYDPFEEVDKCIDDMAVDKAMAVGNLYDKGAVGLQVGKAVVAALLGFGEEGYIFAGPTPTRTGGDYWDYLDDYAIKAGRGSFALKLITRAFKVSRGGTRAMARLNRVLRFRGLAKPSVADARLRNLVNQMYRADARIGAGSTADAIRWTKITGQLVGGSNHVKKGRDSVRALYNWLRAAPGASAADREAARALIRDLEEALRRSY